MFFTLLFQERMHQAVTTILPKKVLGKWRSSITLKTTMYGHNLYSVYDF